MKLTGAQALIKSLEMEGTEVAFGLPGGAILPAYDPIIDSPIRHILVRHEQGAGHMAEGYAHVTGRPGVAIVTSGPAATNIVTPLCDAYMDSVPIVVITGQVSRAMIGTDGFQECDTVGITRSVTKHNELVMNPDDITMAIRQAFHIATTGRPGPVLVDLPKDVLQAATDWNWPTDAEVAASLPGYRPTTKGHPRMIKEAARLIGESRRPVIYAGGGILNSHAAAELRELAELTGIHVVTTLMARGAFPDSHPLCLGMPGMHGNFTAITAMQRADLLIALGSRFDDRVTGRVGSFAPDAKVIHVDIDPAELGKIRRPDVPIVGDARLVIEQLVLEVRALMTAAAAPPPAPPALPARPAPGRTGRRGTARSTHGGASSRSTTTPPRTGTSSSRNMSSRRSGTRPPTTPSWSPGWASTRCGPASTGASSTPTRGSTRVASAPWASRCPPPSEPRSAAPTRWCGRSTATAASR